MQICFQRYQYHIRKSFQWLHVIVCDSHYHVLEDQSHSHVTAQNGDVIVAVIGAFVECAATRGPIERLFEMQILRLPSVYSVMFCDKPASCTHLWARGTGRACREFIGQWWRLVTNACCSPPGLAPSNINPLFS